MPRRLAAPARRRIILAAAALSAGLPAAPAWAQAGAFPTRPIRIVVGFAAGTPPDVFARLFGAYLSTRVGQPVVIENRAGVAGNLATDAVARAPADGYTLLYNLSTGFTINPFIYRNLPFDPARDLVPVATTIRLGLVLIARNNLPANTLRDLVAVARARPNSITFGSYGAGTPSHLIMEWFKEQSGMQMVHVPYRASPMPDVIGGQIDTSMSPLPSAFPMINAGRVRALAYSGPARNPNLPDVPTLAEVAPGVAMMSWHGVWAPAGTPAALLDRLNALFVAASNNPDLARRIRELNSEPIGVSRAEMASMVQRDADIYGRIARTRNIRLD
jgi:tripartite-type tricarboxylate transporter receptor subunit TctC